jgi:hypothetical protein
VKEEQVIDTDGQTLTKTTYTYGTVEYINTKGEIHRIGGPALIWSDGTQEYYLEDKMHRTNGPAIVYTDGSSEYWVGGVKYTEDEYPKAVFNYKLKQLVG